MQKDGDNLSMTLESRQQAQQNIGKHREVDKVDGQVKCINEPRQ